MNEGLQFARSGAHGVREDKAYASIEIPLGIISVADFHQYLAEVVAALDIHLEREQIRQGLWKEYPASDQMNQIRIKADRISRSLEIISGGTVAEDGLRANAVEENFDIINYAIFANRIIRGTHRS